MLGGAKRPAETETAEPAAVPAAPGGPAAAPLPPRRAVSTTVRPQASAAGPERRAAIVPGAQPVLSGSGGFAPIN
jgi:hypothetical protein